MPPTHSMSELRHDAFVHLDIPALAQIPGLGERLALGVGRAVLDCDYSPHGRHGVVRRDDHTPDSSPTVAGEQSQFDAALRIDSGHDGREYRV